MDTNSSIEERIAAQERTLEAIYKSVEQTRRYFLWTLIITTVFFVVPLIALAFVIPAFLSDLSSLMAL